MQINGCRVGRSWVPSGIYVRAAEGYLLECFISECQSRNPMQNPLEFTCPHCGTAYHVVQIQADVHSDVKVDCLVCGRPLQASDGRSFFKYFLIDRLQVSLRQLLATDRDEMFMRESAAQ